jgi:hypothetical protein
MNREKMKIRNMKRRRVLILKIKKTPIEKVSQINIVF